MIFIISPVIFIYTCLTLHIVFIVFLHNVYRKQRKVPKKRDEEFYADYIIKSTC